MEKTKVCHVTSVHSMKDGRIFEKECSSLSKAGFEVYIVGHGDDGEENGVKFINVNGKKGRRIQRILLFDELVIKKALELNCDVYHLHDPELLRYARQIKRAGHKVIFDSHEDVPRQICSKYWIPRIIRGFISNIYETYEKKICREIDAVITATSKIHDIFILNGIENEIIYNYPIIKNEYIQEEKKKNVICFAGGLSRSNGILQLIDVVNELDNVELKLAGKFEPYVEKYFNKHKNKNKRMEYLGILDKKGVGELYYNSTVGIVADLPTGNNIEGLPIKLFEYMEYGLPIVTSKFPLREKIFEEYDCGKLIDPYDKTAYLTAIQEILENKAYQLKCAENGHRAVNEKYNWKSQEAKLVKLYERL